MLWLHFTEHVIQTFRYTIVFKLGRLWNLCRTLLTVKVDQRSRIPYAAKAISGRTDAWLHLTEYTVQPHFNQHCANENLGHIAQSDSAVAVLPIRS